MADMIEKRRSSSFKINDVSGWHSSLKTVTVMRAASTEASVLHFNPRRRGHAYQEIPVGKSIVRTIALRKHVVDEALRLHLIGSGRKYDVVILLPAEDYNSLYDLRGE